jgi:hypothetical protein
MLRLIDKWDTSWDNACGAILAAQFLGRNS